MGGLPKRLSDWIVAHPIAWGVGLGTVLVLVGFALDLPPVVVVVVGSACGVLNVLHARRRGYCPLPADTPPQPEPK